MVELTLARETAERLARYVESTRAEPRRSEHWHHYGAMNRLSVGAGGSAVVFHAGAGFDSEYELSFRSPTLRETAGSLARRLAGREPTARFAAAFGRIWNGKKAPVTLEETAAVLGGPVTAHKILAAHYASLLLPHLPSGKDFTYLEIGPGSAYLAALVHHLRPGPVILIDLPDMLPFSFLSLHRMFPGEPFCLPNEAWPPAPITGSRFLFLTAAQAHLVPDSCADLAVNTASFGEMLPEQVDAYFSTLRRASRPSGLFFTSNRVEKWMTRPGALSADGSQAACFPMRSRTIPGCRTTRISSSGHRSSTLWCSPKVP